MRSSLQLAIIVGLAATAGRAHGQTSRVAPSDVDLRAAYCAEMDKHLLNDVGKVGTAGAKQVIDVDALKRNYARLQAYVDGRLLYIEPLMMASAVKSADSDNVAADSAASSGNPYRAKDVAIRASRCLGDLSWLPF